MAETPSDSMETEFSIFWILMGTGLDKVSISTLIGLCSVGHLTIPCSEQSQPTGQTLEIEVILQETKPLEQVHPAGHWSAGNGTIEGAGQEIVPLLQTQLIGQTCVFPGSAGQETVWPSQIQPMGQAGEDGVTNGTGQETVLSTQVHPSGQTLVVIILSVEISIL